jgi:hypothetical protein
LGGGGKYEIVQTLLSFVVILGAAFFHDVRVVIGLAFLVLAIGLGHVAWRRRQEKAMEVALANELEQMDWKLVPVPAT